MINVQNLEYRTGGYMCGELLVSLLGGHSHDEFDTLNSTLIKVNGELAACLVKKLLADEQNELFDAENTELKNTIHKQLERIGQLETETVGCGTGCNCGGTPEQRLSSILDDTTVSNATWYRMTLLIQDRFKANGIQVAQIDLPSYQAWFNNNVAGAIRGNKGTWKMMGDTEYYSCTKADMVRVLINSWAPFSPYRQQIHDCDDFVIDFLSELSRVYGINAGAFIEGDGSLHGVNNIAHAFVNVWCLDGPVTIDVTRTKDMWCTNSGARLTGNGEVEGSCMELKNWRYYKA